MSSRRRATPPQPHQPTRGERTAAARVRADERLKLYDGHYHDLLNDLDKEAVMTDITYWIDARLPRG